MESLNVNLGDRSYPIHFSEDFDQLKGQLDVFLKERQFSSITIITNPAIAKLTHNFSFFPKYHQKIIVVAEGEKSKNFETIQHLCEELLLNHVDRKSLLVAIGGVINDIVGFVASIYKRGVPYINIPTTLLSAVDSSIGGKNGISLCAAKNCIGTFHQPKAVFCCPKILQTLPPVQFSFGMAEVIKYALLNKELWTLLTSLPSPLTAQSPNLSEVIMCCCKIKADIVEEDETEQTEGSGRIFLNLGHTTAHALEIAAPTHYSHGEAVSIGLCAALLLSQNLKVTPSAPLAQLQQLLSLYKLPTKLKRPISLAKIHFIILKDKKYIGKNLRLVLLKSIGRPVCYVTPNLSSLDPSLIQLGFH